MKTLIYLRVSTDKQDCSIEVQREKCLKYCEMNDLVEPTILIDSDTSGTVPLQERDNGMKLLLKDVTCVVALKLDRLFRNTIDGLQCADIWIKNKTTVYIVDQEGVSVSTRSATGRFIFTTLLSTAELERGLTAERISQTLQYKKKNGLCYGPVPYGFDILEFGEPDKDGKRKKKLITNEKEIEVVNYIFHQKKVAKQSLQSIADDLTRKHILTKKGSTEWSKSTVHSILTNDIYTDHLERV